MEWFGRGVKQATVVMNLSWKSGFSRNQDDSACDQN
jgi:hypothetical protein